MSRRSEYDAAYFTLLRAREELDHLRRYEQFLVEELDRLAAFVTAVDDAPEVVPPKYRRMVDATARPVTEAVGRRRAIVASEQRKMPERIAAQEAFVQECEEDLASLR